MRLRRGRLFIASTALIAGCTIAPRDFFRSNDDPAPVVRARSLGLGRGLPEEYVIPTLIAKLHDPDAVVRMTAHEELRRRTGQDFGYAPWADPTERAPAVNAWNRWWQGRRVELARTHALADPSLRTAGYAVSGPGRGLFGRRRRSARMESSMEVIHANPAP